jgi:PAS domain S-box-containing protein
LTCDVSLTGRSEDVDNTGDVAEQKRVEEALRESELRYRTLFEASGNAILILHDDRFTDCNARTLTMFGASREQIIGAPPFAFSPSVQPDGRASKDKAFEKIHLALTEGRQFFEWLHAREDGTPFDTEVTLSPIVLGGEVLLQAIVRDISSRKQAEREAKLAAAHVQYLSQYANDFIILLDEQFCFLEVNERVVDGYGYTREELIGARASLLRAPEALDSFVEQMERTRASGKELYETVHRCKSGETFPVEINLRTIDKEGRRLYLSVIRDISERKRADEQVRRLNDELRRRAEDMEQRVRDRTAQLAARNQELKDFAYTVSHDLKAPLRGIAGYAKELERKHRAGLSDRAQFCLTQILTAASHLDQLIEDLLRYSRLDAETPSYAVVDLPGLVGMILRDRDLTLKEQGAMVTVELPFATLHSWERGLMQVLCNLVDNAIKYSRKATPPRVHIAATSLEHAWQVKVSDNGVGFDMKYHDRLFKLFNRLVRMEDFEGTGAGLAIARRVVDKLGGRIWAESEPGHGATFFVELPKPADRT